ncbi:MAG: alanine racemase [Gammaproteobacteria bacterium]
MRRVVADIDASALAHNLAIVRALAADSRVLAVVKADAYGHDLVPTARTLASAGADGFGVACVEEALALRESGIRERIVVLEGVTASSELVAARNAGLELVVHADWQLAMLERDGVRGLCRLWIKFNTGMNRLGFPMEVSETVRSRFDALGASSVLMSHLACADEPEREENARQLQAFENLRTAFPGAASLANSAAVLTLPAAHYDWVRPGLLLYGVSPLPDCDAAALGLCPAMTLKARILAVQDVAAGAGVGYGEDWRAPLASRVAIASIGYGDGYPWRGAQGASALVHGRRVPLVGRVSMDMLGLDVTAIAGVAPGDEVVLWGKGLSVEEVARAAGTIPYELVCDVTRRVPRVYSEASEPADAAVA